MKPHGASPALVFRLLLLCSARLRPLHGARADFQRFQHLLTVLTPHIQLLTTLHTSKSLPHTNTSSQSLLHIQVLTTHATPPGPSKRQRPRAEGRAAGRARAPEMSLDRTTSYFLRTRFPALRTYFPPSAPKEQPEPRPAHQHPARAGAAERGGSTLPQRENVGAPIRDTAGGVGRTLQDVERQHLDHGGALPQQLRARLLEVARKRAARAEVIVREELPLRARRPRSARGGRGREKGSRSWRRGPPQRTQHSRLSSCRTRGATRHAAQHRRRALRRWWRWGVRAWRRATSSISAHMSRFCAARPT